MKIYVVTKGCYSDYRIVAATVDKEKAEKIAAKFSDGWETADVEEYEDSDIYFKTVWFIRIDTNGNICECHKGADNEEYYYNAVGVISRNKKGQVYMYVSADTSEEACKIASERYPLFVAREKGLI